MNNSRPLADGTRKFVLLTRQVFKNNELDSETFAEVIERNIRHSAWRKWKSYEYVARSGDLEISSLETNQTDRGWSGRYHTVLWIFKLSEKHHTGPTKQLTTAIAVSVFRVCDASSQTLQLSDSQVQQTLLDSAEQSLLQQHHPHTLHSTYKRLLLQWP